MRSRPSEIRGYEFFNVCACLGSNFDLSPKVVYFFQAQERDAPGADQVRATVEHPKRSFLVDGEWRLRKFWLVGDLLGAMYDALVVLNLGVVRRGLC